MNESNNIYTINKDPFFGRYLILDPDGNIIDGFDTLKEAQLEWPNAILGNDLDYAE